MVRDVHIGHASSGDHPDDLSRTDVFLKSSVIEIVAIFGKGGGTFVNNTNIADVVYGGGAGGNVLIGGDFIAGDIGTLIIAGKKSKTYN